MEKPHCAYFHFPNIKKTSDSKDVKVIQKGTNVTVALYNSCSFNVSPEFTLSCGYERLNVGTRRCCAPLYLHVFYIDDHKVHHVLARHKAKKKKLIKWRRLSKTLHDTPYTNHPLKGDLHKVQ